MALLCNFNILCFVDFWSTSEDFQGNLQNKTLKSKWEKPRLHLRARCYCSVNTTSLLNQCKFISFSASWHVQRTNLRLWLRTSLTVTLNSSSDEITYPVLTEFHCYDREDSFVLKLKAGSVVSADRSLKKKKQKKNTKRLIHAATPPSGPRPYLSLC